MYIEPEYIEDDNSIGGNPDRLEALRTPGNEHPMLEQSLFREAVKRALMRDQQKIWELYNFDKLTPTEIAKKLKKTPQNISQRIKVIERLLITWVQEHKQVYEALKEASNDNDIGC
jgi:predicted DNA-binding protein YlxM (UPF0122 family)